MRIRFLVAMSAFCVPMPPAAVRAQMPEHFTLGKYIPDDVWLYIHGAQTPDSKWLHEQWSRVWRALDESGIANDLVGLVLSMAPAEERAAWEAKIHSSKDLAAAVGWSDIFCGKEFAFAERGSTTALGYDYFLLSRSTPEMAAANYQALVRIMKRIGEASPRIRVALQEVQGTPTQVLFLSGQEMGATGIRLTVFCKNDVLAMVTGKASVRDVIRRIDRETSARGIVDLPRFQSALGQVSPPEVQISYFDMRMLMQDIMSQMKGDKMPMPYPEMPPALQQVRKVAEQFDVFEYFISSSQIENQRQTTQKYGLLQKGKENQAFARVLTDRKPFEPFDKYVPSRATAFSLHGMINLEHLYNGIIKYIQNETPNGSELLAPWNAALTQFGVEPQRDLFDWWSGETISISLPAAMVTPMSREDFVLMVRVKDSATAAQKVNGLLDTVAALFKEQGQALMLQPAKVRVEGFRQITHPMLTLLMQPVIGVHDGWLMVGSSAGAINQCLAVAAGEAPSIRKNERFAAEGIAPDGPVESAFFKDTSRCGEEMTEAVGMVGVVAGLLPMFNLRAGDDDSTEAAQVMGLVQKALPIVAKLGPVLREVDFYSSEAGVSRFDGSAWREKSVTVYKSTSTLEETRLARKKPAPGQE